MKQYLLLLLASISCSQTFAYNLDIYGADAQIEKDIMACCSGQLIQYDKAYKEFFTQGPNDELFKPVAKLEHALLKKIKKVAPFAYAKISTIYYPNDKSNYITLDLVKKNESYRLPKSPHRQTKTIKKNPELTRLFRLWETYSETNNLNPQKNQMVMQNCPVSHCIWGFDAIEQKKYLPIFNRDSLKYKQELMDIVSYSNDEKDRDEAIFLLGHLKNYQELADFLIQFSDDKNEVVRNNSMRVLTYILHKHPLPHLDIKRIITALDYPCTTDRNKASGVLLGMVKDKSTHQRVIREAGPTLIKLIRLKQPNNHDFAYLILKVISQKQFAENDYDHWQRWLEKANQRTAIS